MEKSTSAILLTILLAVIGVTGDYFLKRASDQSSPYFTRWFAIGFAVYCSSAFGWVYVMRHMTFASLGIVYAASMILLLTLVGVTLLQESLRWQEIVGIVLALASIALLSRFA